MKPVRHSTSNAWLLAPKGAGILDVPKALPVTKNKEGGMEGVLDLQRLTTHWQPSEQDIANLLAGGVLQLSLYTGPANAANAGFHGMVGMVGLKVVPSEGVIQPEIMTVIAHVPPPKIKPPHLR